MPSCVGRTVPLVLAVALAAAAGCGVKSTQPATTPATPAAAAPPPSTGAAGAPAPAAAGIAPAARRQSAGPPPLTGLVTREAVESFDDVWKGLRAQDYEPDATGVATIRDNLKDVEVFAVVATWCPDTRRDLPRFFKIVDRAQWPMKTITLLAVDRTKKDAGGLTEKWNVTRVPTFIFTRGGREIGRVVERPTTTLEKDIAAILAAR
jgi:hypothetical protein